MSLTSDCSMIILCVFIIPISVNFLILTRYLDLNDKSNLKATLIIYEDWISIWMINNKLDNFEFELISDKMAKISLKFVL